MNWKQHLFIGIIFELLVLGGLIYYDLFSYSIFLIISTIFVILFSPLVPDLDHENGKLQHGLMSFGLFVGLIGLVLHFFSVEYYEYPLYFGILLANIIHFNADYSKHRGLWHSLITNILYILVLYLGFNWQLALIGGVGFWSHLLCDKIPFKLK